MDKFFVWDKDKQFVEDFFAEVLYNHLAMELGLPMELDPAEKTSVVLNEIFTQQKVLSEICRASEGNARDLLVLFGKAHSVFRQQTAHQHIGLDDVHRAAVELYRNDKYSNISSEKPLEEFLEHLVHVVIKEKRSRTFMVPYQARLHPILARLYSARLLHPLDVEWSHPHIPGERYSLVTMDFGTYVSFKGTTSEPEQLAFWAINDPKTKELDLVPVDDRRSIRRIVVEHETLEEYWQRLITTDKA